MPAKQSYDVTMALKWLDRTANSEAKTRTVKAAAKKFGVHESTLWRALGRMNHRKEVK